MTLTNDMYSTEAFGPRRGARGDRPSPSPYRQSPARQQDSPNTTNPSPVRQQPANDHVADLSTMDGYLSEVCIYLHNT